MTKIKKICSEIFCINRIINYSIPKINFTFAENGKKGFENDSGYGVYYLKFFNEIIYIGSYCAEGSVVKQRWWTHIASISARFKEINFLKQEKPSLKNILNNDDLEIQVFLKKKKEKFLEKYTNIFVNSNFKEEIFQPLNDLKSSDKQNLSLLLGDGSCMTFPHRISCVNKYWNDIKDFNENDLLNSYIFYYHKISKDEKIFSNLSNFLYSNSYEKKIKNNFFQDYIEETIIHNFNPCGNKKKDIKNFILPSLVLKDADNFINLVCDDIKSTTNKL